ncbi:MAG: 4'-phosphopantetheinyl transferase superfamily protein [Coriobacteriia bacterium]|nr:4'-phosphopantetheinyl transferase superfamily protein [Coriobacteriia bacterium]
MSAPCPTIHWTARSIHSYSDEQFAFDLAHASKQRQDKIRLLGSVEAQKSSMLAYLLLASLARNHFSIDELPGFAFLAQTPSVDCTKQMRTGDALVEPVRPHRSTGPTKQMRINGGADNGNPSPRRTCLPGQRRTTEEDINGKRILHPESEAFVAQEKRDPASRGHSVFPGKPSLAGFPGLHFSISHSKGLALAALGDTPVGVDVQAAQLPSASLLSKAFSPAERTLVESSADPSLAFAHLWAKKESLLKLTGEGIRSLSQLARALEGSSATFETGFMIGDEATTRQACLEDPTRQNLIASEAGAEAGHPSGARANSIDARSFAYALCTQAPNTRFLFHKEP